MNESSVYRTFDELPMFINVATVSKVLGISASSGYELMHEKDFPSIKIGSKSIPLIISNCFKGGSYEETYSGSNQN